MTRLGAALACFAASCAPADRPGVPEGTPVVLVIIDTLRADRLGAYGCELDTSPVLDALAERSWVFENATTQCNATLPSIASILTGVYVRTHRNYLAVPIEGLVRTDAQLVALPERLGSAGYHCAAIVSHPSWRRVPPNPGFVQGWDSFSLIPEIGPPEERDLLGHGVLTNERAFALLEAYEQRVDRDGARPLFLWTHYFDPHTDLPFGLYDPPPELRDRYLAHHLERAGALEHLADLRGLAPREMHEWIQGRPTAERVELGNAVRRALYDAEVRAADEALGQLFDRLRSSGLLERALIVVMADHGENMAPNEHDPHAYPFTHKGLLEGVVHVPLIVHLPGQTRGERVGALVQNVDVAPTLLDLLGLPPLERADGASLLPLLEDPDGVLHERVFVESSDNVERAVKDTTWKYIGRGDERPDSLFRWREDPSEARDLIDAAPDEAQRSLERTLEEFEPEERLHVRFHPAREPYDVALDVRFEQTVLEDATGGGVQVLGEGHLARVRTRVAGEPVDVLLFPERRNSGSVWHVVHGATDRPQERTFLGQLPIARTPAIPLWQPADAPAPPSPTLALAHDAATGRWSARFRTAAPARLEVELRYLAPGYAKAFEVVESSAFGALAPWDLPAYRATADGASEAALTVRHHLDDPRIAALVRIDGAWPDPASISLDGAAVRASPLAFRLPWPLDKRITTLLLAGPGSEPPPPGAIQIWLDSGPGGELAIDPELLDADSARQLRALGYLDEER